MRLLTGSALACFVAVLSLAAPAGAQYDGGPPPAGMSMGTTNLSGPVGTIFLYSRPGLAGRATQLHRPVANLANVGFGGMARSASVVSGRWQLCTGVRYSPPCYTVVPGRYRRLFGSRGNIWSARPI